MINCYQFPCIHACNFINHSTGSRCFGGSSTGIGASYRSTHRSLASLSAYIHVLNHHQKFSIFISSAEISLDDVIICFVGISNSCHIIVVIVVIIRINNQHILIVTNIVNMFHSGDANLPSADRVAGKKRSRSSDDDSNGDVEWPCAMAPLLAGVLHLLKHQPNNAA